MQQGNASDLVGLLVSGHQTHSLDEGVSRIVHARLDGLVQREAVGRGLITQGGVDGGRQVARHAVVVLAQVGVLGTAQTGNRLQGWVHRRDHLPSLPWKRR